jgi:hypothetical protein
VCKRRRVVGGDSLFEGLAVRGGRCNRGGHGGNKPSAGGGVETEPVFPCSVVESRVDGGREPGGGVSTTRNAERLEFPKKGNVVICCRNGDMRMSGNRSMRAGFPVQGAHAIIEAGTFQKVELHSLNVGSGVTGRCELRKGVSHMDVGPEGGQEETPRDVVPKAVRRVRDLVKLAKFLEPYCNELSA